MTIAEPRPLLERALVVDDHPDSVEALVVLISRMGARVRVACDGPRALQVAAEFVPQLVLLDLVLPGMDGYRIARGIREQSSLRGVRLVGITGLKDAEASDSAANAGFDRLLRKPIDFHELKQVLSQHFRFVGESAGDPALA